MIFLRNSTKTFLCLIGYLLLLCSPFSLAQNDEVATYLLSWEYPALTSVEGTWHRQLLVYTCDGSSHDANLEFSDHSRILVDHPQIIEFYRQVKLCNQGRVELPLSVLASHGEPLRATLEVERTSTVGSFSSSPRTVLRTTPLSYAIYQADPSRTSKRHQAVKGNLLVYEIQPWPIASSLLVGQSYRIQVNMEIEGIEPNQAPQLYFDAIDGIKFHSSEAEISRYEDEFRLPIVNISQRWILLPDKAGDYQIKVQSPIFLVNGSHQSRSIDFSIRVTGVDQPTQVKEISTEFIQDRAKLLSPSGISQAITHSQEQDIATLKQNYLYSLGANALAAFVIIFLLFKGIIAWLWRKVFSRSTSSLATFKLCQEACNHNDPQTCRTHLFEMFYLDGLLETRSDNLMVVKPRLKGQLSLHQLEHLEQVCFSTDTQWDNRGMTEWLRDYYRWNYSKKKAR